MLLVCKDKFVESNTYHAQGGVATAIFNDDSPALHATDTMAAGHGLCDRTAVDILTDEGARRVRELIGDGWHVDRDSEGHVLRGLEAAHCRSRVVHAGGDATGKVLELDVSAMVRENPNITVLEHAFLNDVLVRDGHVAGVRLAVRDAQDGVEVVPVHHESRGGDWRRPGRCDSCRGAGRRPGVLPVPSHGFGYRRAFPRLRSRAWRRRGTARRTWAPFHGRHRPQGGTRTARRGGASQLPYHAGARRQADHARRFTHGQREP